MPNTNNIRISLIVVLRIIVLLLIIVFGFSAYSQFDRFLKYHPMFAVTDVLISKHAQFIDHKPLKALKGRNIFSIDIVYWQRYLTMRYPQLAQVRVVRDLPNRLKILAIPRQLAFQFQHRKGWVLVDLSGKVVMVTKKSLGQILELKGISDKVSVVGGKPIEHAGVKVALTIVQQWRQLFNHQQMVINHLDVSNLGKIIVHLNTGYYIILDSDHPVEQLKVFAMLVAEKKVKKGEVAYVDLRFARPVIAPIMAVPTKD